MLGGLTSTHSGSERKAVGNVAPMGRRPGSRLIPILLALASLLVVGAMAYLLLRSGAAAELVALVGGVMVLLPAVFFFLYIFYVQNIP